MLSSAAGAMISMVDTTLTNLGRQLPGSKSFIARESISIRAAPRGGAGPTLPPIDGTGVSRYLAGGRKPAVNAKLKESHEDRISREEQHWNTPRLLRLGLLFLAAALAFIYFIASI